jgi:ABC-type multidrug transport system fused ATPase/permease subunit
LNWPPSCWTAFTRPRLVDGTDIAFLDPFSLRRQIGVVLQENVLINRTIGENIALAIPASRWSG